MNEKPVIHIPPEAAVSTWKRVLKAAARLLALVVVAPVVLGYWLNAQLIGRGRALESATQLLSLVPGVSGQYLRRAFLQCALARCHPSATVEFGTFFSQPGACLDENVYIGPRCILGWVHLERDVLLAANVHIPSGGHTHYFHDPTKPIREQGGERTLVTIGEGAWIGTGAIILADVGAGAVVAAGSVVTKPVPENVIVAGVPAQVIRHRFATSPREERHG
ncbi:MAG: DapH/DapD/GlmU-related protein [Gemmataceae bacterium]|nr:DapH/DapD/GlmU-related protein [Gemmataceae bacterium]